MTDRLLTTREVCQRLGICMKSLQVLRTHRKIAYIRFGHRSIRFREEAVRDRINYGNPNYTPYQTHEKKP